MTDANESVLERKTPPKASEGQIDEFIYMPGPQDPVHTTVGGEIVNNLPRGGYTFVANVPQKLPRKSTTTKVLVRQERELPDGQIVSRSVEKNVPLYDLLRDNPCFMINGVPPRPRSQAHARLPTEPDQYRGYAIKWMSETKDGATLKTRWDGEEQLREQLGVSTSDLAYLVPFLQGKLMELGGARTVPAIPL